MVAHGGRPTDGKPGGDAMTIKDVQGRLDMIKVNSDRREGPRAHEREDDLFLAVLRAIADGTAEDPVALAREALKSAELEFDRWYE
jgi:hypothetical protein